MLFSNYACWHGKHTSITFFIFNLYYSSRFNTPAAPKTWKVFFYLSTKNASRANTDCKLRLTPAVREPFADTLRRAHQPSRHEGAPLLQNSYHISPFLGEDYRVQGHQGPKTSIHPPRPDALPYARGSATTRCLQRGFRATGCGKVSPQADTTRGAAVGRVREPARPPSTHPPPPAAPPRCSQEAGAMPLTRPRSLKATDSREGGGAPGGRHAPALAARPRRSGTPSPPRRRPTSRSRSRPLTPCSPPPPLAPRPPTGSAPPLASRRSPRP